MTGRSAGVVAQPGAKDGNQVYCPVSGVVFAVKPESTRRTLDGSTVYFCCEACAHYFDQHREQIARLRGLAPARTN